MSFYERDVLPYIIDCACGMKALNPERERLVAAAHGTVLEIGFGSGLNLPYLPSSVKRVLAVDPAVRARAIAKKRIANARCAVEPVGLDAGRIGLRDSSADTALSTFTLCTIPDAGAALREVKRVLKPGGKLLFLEHGRAPDRSVARWQERLNPLQRALFGGCNLNRDIPKLLRDQGFELESLEQRYFPEGPRTHGYLYSGSARAV